MNASAPEQTWRVGELAERTGLTVRTLHHYHEIGLLVPSLLTDAGHRRYTGADLRRLHRILALRGFGFALAEIGAILDERVLDPRALVQRQLDQVDAQLAAGQRLRGGLLRVLDRLTEPTSENLIELIEVMTVNQQLTQEQFDRMAQERSALLASLTPEEVEAMNERRRQFAAGLSERELAEMSRRRAALRPPVDG